MPACNSLHLLDIFKGVVQNCGVVLEAAILATTQKRKDGKTMAKKPPFTAEYISNGADSRLQPEAQELAEQLFFMRAKLEELREELKEAPVVTEYDNGGQQRGTHINPAFKAHKDLIGTYTRTLSALEAIIGKKDPNEGSDFIEQFRNRIKTGKLRPDTEPDETKAATGTDGEVGNYWKAGKK